jgi:chromosome segregation ATPase
MKEAIAALQDKVAKLEEESAFHHNAHLHYENRAAQMAKTRSDVDDQIEELKEAIRHLENAALVLGCDTD